MELTTKWLKERDACRDGIDWFEQQKNKDLKSITDKLYNTQQYGWCFWLSYRTTMRARLLLFGLISLSFLMSILSIKYTLGTNLAFAVVTVAFAVVAGAVGAVAVVGADVGAVAVVGVAGAVTFAVVAVASAVASGVAGAGVVAVAVALAVAVVTFVVVAVGSSLSDKILKIVCKFSMNRKESEGR